MPPEAYVMAMPKEDAPQTILDRGGYEEVLCSHCETLLICSAVSLSLADPLCPDCVGKVDEEHGFNSEMKIHETSRREMAEHTGIPLDQIEKIADRYEGMSVKEIVKLMGGVGNEEV